ncbi:MAG: VTT domain-containing protein [Anaerolineales bacterium]|jgi:uncharacterized membrane protein YdjX (TVP38/TMEM64 family)|nr:VTT domain-containing protein [Anaerolineales bacterium]
MQKPTSSKRSLILRGLSLAAFLAITIFVFSVRERAAELAVYGYPGIFLVAMLSSATVLFPAPGLAIVFGMSGVFHPFGVALAAGCGAAIGEITGFLAGISGRGVIERSDIYIRLEPFVRKYGAIAIIVLAAIPNPFFDLASIAAGALKLPFWKFLLAVWAGQMIKMTLVAYAGSLSLGWFLSFP